MLKKFVVIEYEEKPILVVPVTEGETKDFIDLKKQAKENRENLVLELKGKIDDLEKEVAALKSEIKYLKGEN